MVTTEVTTLLVPQNPKYYYHLSQPISRSFHAADQSQPIANTSSLIRLHRLTAQPPSTTNNFDMIVPIRIVQVVSALWLFQSLVAAFPPAVQARTTPSLPDSPATRIIITSLIPSTGASTSSAATPSRTATDTLISQSQSQSQSQPPNRIPVALLDLRAPISILSLSTDSDTNTITGPPTSTSISMAITPFALPSGISSISALQEKWYLTTFWSCVTDDVQTHCGWHEPVLPGGNQIAAAAHQDARRGRGERGLLAVIVAVVVEGGALLV